MLPPSSDNDEVEVGTALADLGPGAYRNVLSLVIGDVRDVHEEPGGQLDGHRIVRSIRS